jgi:NAD(P)-dependent dehydrogenase (short-subunit alcohol dehydrogenase family)
LWARLRSARTSTLRVVREASHARHSLPQALERPAHRPCAKLADKQLAAYAAGAYLRDIDTSRRQTMNHPIETSAESPWRGLRVAVTGGTSGLGLALAQLLVERGARVALVARDAARVAQVAATLPGSHGIVGDVAKKADIHRIALQVGAALGGLDVLVNNASSLGPVPLAALADTDCEDLEAALATNLLGPFRLTKALLGSLAAAARESAGPGAGVARRCALVVNIGSDAALTPYPGWGAYGASKAALVQLSRIWDAELREHGVRVLALDPGDMDTPLHALALPDVDPATLKQPRDAALELLAAVEATWTGAAGHTA